MALYCVREGEIVQRAEVERLHRASIGRDWIPVFAASADEAMEIAVWWDVTGISVVRNVRSLYILGGVDAVAQAIALARGDERWGR